MDDDVLKQKIRNELLGDLYPDLVEVDPQVERGVSESKLRAYRRRGAPVTESVRRELPIERRLVYQRPATEDQPVDRTLVVVTDDDGAIQFIIESK